MKQREDFAQKSLQVRNKKIIAARQVAKKKWLSLVQLRNFDLSSLN